MTVKTLNISKKLRQYFARTQCANCKNPLDLAVKEHAVNLLQQNPDKQLGKQLCAGCSVWFYLDENGKLRDTLQLKEFLYKRGYVNELYISFRLNIFREGNSVKVNVLRGQYKRRTFASNTYEDNCWVYKQVQSSFVINVNDPYHLNQFTRLIEEKVREKNPGITLYSLNEKVLYDNVQDIFYAIKNNPANSPKNLIMNFVCRYYREVAVNE